jgi:hypothetical protein
VYTYVWHGIPSNCSAAATLSRKVTESSKAARFTV